MTLALKQIAPAPGAPVSVPIPEWFRWATVQEPASRFVNANDSRLHYLSWNMQDTSKPVLLFVHGFRAHARWWGFIAPFFTETHRVIAMDLSGMGDSAWRDCYSTETIADDITGLIETLGLDQVTIVAHSYGGLCSFRAASRRPELFRHMIVIDTFVIFEDIALPTDPAPITGRTYPDYVAARKRYRLLPEQPPAADYVMDYVAHHSMRAADGGFRWKFDGRLQAQDTHLCDGEAMLSAVTAPVDYVCGERSALVSREHAERVVANLREARGPIAVPDGQHHLMLDQPLTVISTLRALLASRRK
ncbi:alpha/beta fold hydrolase [Noviherbaspirillum saxi]|uniref:Alpha/beta hydrolase n=1 Tax=Noviherbaspirillum saxi TaxID=2320863 RepID=A0A3A3FK22_9BURK|nr:alpha/beta hydrolase [Noviherbaspirillum saxi]RJF91685.1 alpha/beta hydrolase [Noviherbaspirillum saxi]